MARKDIPDWLVVLCAEQMRARWQHLEPAKIADPRLPWLHLVRRLAFATGQPEKVCYAACERSSRRRLIDYGISVRGAWPTPEGLALLSRFGGA